MENLKLAASRISSTGQSYLRDEVGRSKTILRNYAFGASLFLTAVIFFMGSILVGCAALFRWIELNYGTFQAFGITAGLLVILAVTFLVAGKLVISAKPKKVLPLSSRLRVVANSLGSEALRESKKKIVMSAGSGRSKNSEVPWLMAAIALSVLVIGKASTK